MHWKIEVVGLTVEAEEMVEEIMGIGLRPKPRRRGIVTLEIGRDDGKHGNHQTMSTFDVAARPSYSRQDNLADFVTFYCSRPSL